MKPTDVLIPCANCGVEIRLSAETHARLSGGPVTCSHACAKAVEEES